MQKFKSEVMNHDDNTLVSHSVDYIYIYSFQAEKNLLVFLLFHFTLPYFMLLTFVVLNLIIIKF